MEKNELIEKLLYDLKTYPNMGFDLYSQKCEALRTLYKREDDVSHALGINLELRKRLNITLNSKTSKIQEQKRLLKKYWQTYLFAAPYCFHSYLLYMEKDRDPEKRFYQPRLKVLRDVVRGLQALADRKLVRLGLSMPPGTGKSTLGIFYITWLVGREPLKPSLATAYVDKLTRSFYDGELQIIKDPEYNFRDIFPDSPLAATNSKDETIDLAKVKRFKTLTCRSIDSGLTGATRCEVLVYADDMVSVSGEAMNRERMDILWTKFCNDKEYIMEYTGNSVRQFEAIGGSTSGMQNKIFTSIDGLIYVGLMKHHPGMNYNLAKKISDSAIEEYGASEIYPVLAEKFTEVFMQEGSQGKKKSFLVSEIKPTKKALNSEQ